MKNKFIKTDAICKYRMFHWRLEALLTNKSHSIITAVIYFFIFSIGNGAVYATDINITLPKGGFTTQRIQKIEGTITGYSGNDARIVINGIPQVLPLHNNKFSVFTVIAPGANKIEIIAGETKKSVSFFADVPKKDVKIVLIWDSKTDVDLWVIDPKGEKCYFSQPMTKSGGNLDMDNTSGYGPETFTMEKALPGPYSVQVQYFSSNDSPVTRVDVYMILYEGTPKEERRHFEFVMTKEHQVYHIASFTIDAKE